MQSKIDKLQRPELQSKKDKVLDPWDTTIGRAVASIGSYMQKREAYVLSDKYSLIADGDESSGCKISLVDLDANQVEDLHNRLPGQKATFDLGKMQLVTVLKNVSSTTCEVAFMM